MQGWTSHWHNRISVTCMWPGCLYWLPFVITLWSALAENSMVIEILSYHTPDITRFDLVQQTFINYDRLHTIVLYWKWSVSLFAWSGSNSLSFLVVVQNCTIEEWPQMEMYWLAVCRPFLQFDSVRKHPTGLTTRYWTGTNDWWQPAVSMWNYLPNSPWYVNTYA